MILHEPLSAWIVAIEDATLFLNLCSKRKPQNLQEIETLYSTHFGKDGGLQGFIDRVQRGLDLDSEISTYPKETICSKVRLEKLGNLFAMMQEIGVADAEISNFVRCHNDGESIDLSKWKSNQLHNIYVGLLQAQDTISHIVAPEPQQAQQGEHSEPQHTPKEKADEDYLTIKLSADMDTSRARKFLGKAIKLGWIREENNKLIWLDIGESATNGKPQRLAYFIRKLYVSQPDDRVPIKACEETFNLKEQLSPRIDKTKNHITRLRDRIDEFFDE